MTIDVACPGCAKSYSLPATQAGKRARCKQCGLEFRIELAERRAESAGIADADLARDRRRR